MQGPQLRVKRSRQGRLTKIVERSSSGRLIDRLRSDRRAIVAGVVALGVLLLGIAWAAMPSFADPEAVAPDESAATSADDLAELIDSRLEQGALEVAFRVLDSGEWEPGADGLDRETRAQAVDELIAIARNGEEPFGLRTLAITTLSELGGPTAAGALVDLLAARPDREIRHALQSAIASFEDTAALQELADRMGSTKTSLEDRLAIADGLSRNTAVMERVKDVRDATVRMLIGVLDDVSQPQARRRALLALSRHSSSAATRRIVRSLGQRDDATVRAAAVLATRELPDSAELTKALRAVADEDPDSVLSQMASKTLTYRAQAPSTR